MSEYCEKILTIESVCGDSYRVDENAKYWQDWMLEDEVVTEEKQEVEQLNKNDMEAKVMTKEEIFEYLNNTKILCTSTEETAKVQEKLFELGIEWMYDGKNVREDKYLLFINKKDTLAYCSDINYWMDDINRRIEPTEILAIQIKEEEKPKFDPKTLQPFDKVLVRDNKDGFWRCNLFSHIYEENKDYSMMCVVTCWKYCIPYNEETKHLAGTNEEAPEFYQV